ncbi:GntR family transcriptional regulator [Pleionea litopenaei]|uniref:GntR family transcriptional regulator n=1 Tax=Pleionea litopenaei TaxID=3070815 RepID=A0AA51RR73_9GAMM|nr:GntR family transcriptional regulator [Pleionea sp. HL-JVS1]WMS86057.1 GntR family transcriptional regulator [Pleionea sp. HL-JVS1]
MLNPFIPLEIAPSSGVPIYRQLIDQIKRMVASEQLKPGDAMPSVRNVASQLAVNPMTISKAYSMLEVEGILERQRGKGMIVSSQMPVAGTLEERLTLLAPSIDSLITEARQLEIDLTTLVSAIRSQYEK